MLVKGVDAVTKYWVKAKRTDTGEWIYGYLWRGANNSFITPYNLGIGYDSEKHCINATAYEVDVNSICRPTGVCNYSTNIKTGGLDIEDVWEGDLIEHDTFGGFHCLSEVKIGKYPHDGSGGEYDAQNCIGIYTEVLVFTCPQGYEPIDFKPWLTYQNVMQLNENCRIVGNIHDDFDIEEWAKNKADSSVD